MKLLFILDHFGIGGAQRQMITLAIGLKKKGHDVQFFIYYPEYKNFSGDLTKNNITINEYQKKFRFDPGVMIELSRLVKNNKYDIVVSFLRTPNLYAELLNIIGHRFPLVVSERSAYPYEKVTFGRKIREQFHRFSTHITVNSHNHRLSMIRVHPWIANKITTIYNGIDLDLYNPGNNFSQKVNSQKSKLLVLSSIRSLKNVNGLVSALIHYKNNYGEPPMINWAGKASNYRDDQETLYAANKLIYDNGLSEYWNWLGERTDVIELLREHDGLILGSFYEGLPNAICEALACGTPVLASNVCDNPRLVQDGVTGFLFDPKNPQDIAKCIYKYFCLNIGERIEMCKNARSYAEKNLSLDRYVSEYEKIFRLLIEKFENKIINQSN